MVQIRRHIYRDKQGYLICGQGNSIFTESRLKAEAIKHAIKTLSKDESFDEINRILMA